MAFRARLDHQAQINSQMAAGIQKTLLTALVKRTQEPEEMSLSEIVLCFKRVVEAQERAAVAEAAALAIPDLIGQLYGEERH